MAVKLAHCDDCGQQIVLAAYVPDLVNTAVSRTGKRRKASYMPLDVVPRPRDDEYANYALSVGRTSCHRITDDWPLDSAETRHTVHFATCPAARPAAAHTHGDTNDDDR